MEERVAEGVKVKNSAPGHIERESTGHEVFWDAKETALPVYGNILPRNAPKLAGPEPAEPLVRSVLCCSQQAINQGQQW